MKTILFQPQRNLDFSMSTGLVKNDGGGKAASNNKQDNSGVDDLDDPGDGQDDDDNKDGDDNQGGKGDSKNNTTKTPQGKNNQQADPNEGDDDDDDGLGGDDKSKQKTSSSSSKSSKQSGQGDDGKGTDDNNNEGDEDPFSLVKTKYGVEGDFEESEEGIVNLIEAIAPNIKKEAVDEVFASNPVLKDFNDHINKGLSIESFKQKHQMIDFSKVDIKEDDVATQEKYYRAALHATGVSDEDIEELVATAKDKQKLFERSKKSLTTLDTIQKERYQARVEAEQEQYRVEQEKADALYKEVQGILKKGVIRGYQVPKETLAKLEEYVFKPVDKQGNSARDKRELTADEALFIDLLISNDFDLKKLNLTPTKNGKTLNLKKKGDNDNRQHIDTGSGGQGGDNKGGTKRLPADLNFFNRD